MTATTRARPLHHTLAAPLSRARREAAEARGALNLEDPVAFAFHRERVRHWLRVLAHVRTERQRAAR